LDTILAKEKIDPKKIKGYEHEEFTHSAIATSILAKKADVGVGVKSVAIENGLDFIQLKDELFFMAMSEELMLDKDVKSLVRRIRHLSEEIAGYKSIGLKRQITGWI
jgi:molybdate-binding protein